jgi:hypothetical protein
LVRAFRYESFLVKPSFEKPAGGKKRNQYDHEWVVIDPFLDGLELREDTADTALRKAIDRLNQQLQSG